jgi:hypothetical protein
MDATPKESEMHIDLKNVKHYSRLSEETLAFSAMLYVDGKKMGTVQNEGRGGAHRYGFHFMYLDGLEARARELPAHEGLPMNMDLLVSLKLEEVLREKDAQKRRRRYSQQAIAAKAKGGVFYTVTYPAYVVEGVCKLDSIDDVMRSVLAKHGTNGAICIYDGVYSPEYAAAQAALA